MILNIKDFLNYIFGKKEDIINYEQSFISKSFDDISREFANLDNFIFLENSFLHLKNKQIVLIPPKYELLIYLFFAFVLVFNGVKVVFIYHDWASQILKNLFFDIGEKNIIFNLINFIHIDNIKDVSANYETIILNFFDDLKEIKQNIPNFSTGIICNDADLDYTTNYVLSSVKYFAGLSKSSLKRLIVDASIYEEFLFRLKSKISLISGSVKSKIISKNFKDIINELYASAIADGADILIGGNIYSDDLELTVFTDVNMDMRIYQKDFFGPFLLILKIDSISTDIESLLSLQPSEGILLFTKESCTLIDHYSALQNNYKFLKRPNKFEMPIHDLLDAYPSLEYALKLIF